MISITYILQYVKSRPEKKYYTNIKEGLFGGGASQSGEGERRG
jgi:hypothetical protein